MINFTPRTMVLTEANPASVASYRIAVAVGGSVLGQAVFPANPEGHTTIPIGLGSSALFTQAMAGKTVKLAVSQIGPDGTESPSTNAPNPGGGDDFVINELPDGAETIEVIL